MSDDKQTGKVDEPVKKVYELVDFEHDGVTYTARKKIHPKVLDLIQRNKAMLAMELMIGKEPYAKLLDSIDDVEEIDAMFKAFNEANDSGNS